MKICAIADIHGSKIWNKFIGENKDCDKFIFLGDYLDPYGRKTTEEDIENLLDIIAFKDDNPDKVVLLFGNHDLHYFDKRMDISSRFSYEYAEKIEKIFMTWLKHFTYSYQIDKTIFTHAGIQDNWFVNDFKGDLNGSKTISEQLNNPEKLQEVFLFGCGSSRGGWLPCGGIFWADVKDILKGPLDGYKQIVGHNQVKDISEIENVTFCDCLRTVEKCLVIEI